MKICFFLGNSVGIFRTCHHEEGIIVSSAMYLGRRRNWENMLGRIVSAFSFLNSILVLLIIYYCVMGKLEMWYSIVALPKCKAEHKRYPPCSKTDNQLFFAESVSIDCNLGYLQKTLGNLSLSEKSGGNLSCSLSKGIQLLDLLIQRMFHC